MWWAIPQQESAAQQKVCMCVCAFAHVCDLCGWCVLLHPVCSVRTGLFQFAAGKCVRLMPLTVTCMLRMCAPSQTRVMSGIPFHKHVTHTPVTNMSHVPLSQTCHCQVYPVTNMSHIPLFQRTLELVQTLELFQDFVRASYREQCSLLTVKTLFLLLLQLIQKYFQLHEIDNHSITSLCIIFTSPSLCVFVFAFVLCTCTFLPLFSDAI